MLIPSSYLPQSQGFQFTSPRQQGIYDGLQRLIGDSPALIFRDACRLMEANPPFSFASHLVCHSFREIESSFRDLLVPHAEAVVIEKDGKNTHKNEIEAVLKLLNVPQYHPSRTFWLEFSGQFNKYAHRESLGLPRIIDDANVAKFLDKCLELFEYLLGKIEEIYSIFIVRFDELLM